MCMSDVGIVVAFVTERKVAYGENESGRKEK